MFDLSFYINILYMFYICYIFNFIFIISNIEHVMFQKYSVNMMRSTVCFTLFYESLRHLFGIFRNICTNNTDIVYKNYHDTFLSYFIFDTIILFYQKIKNIEKRIRIDLLLHHVFAVSILLLISKYRIYPISMMIGLSEGMSIVSGPKLISMHLGYKRITNYFIKFRLLYIIFIRMCMIWPMILCYLIYVIRYCNEIKLNDAIFYISCSFVFVIMLAEMNWINSGRRELIRI